MPLAPVGAVRTLPGPAAVSNPVTITRDGLKVAAGDAAPLDQGLAPEGGKDDGVVQVWDVGGGGPARAFRGRKRGTISRPNWLTGQLVAQFGRG